MTAQSNYKVVCFTSSLLVVQSTEYKNRDKTLLIRKFAKHQTNLMSSKILPKFSKKATQFIF